MARIRTVDAVRLNTLGDVVRVIWGVADSTTNKWLKTPEEAEVIEVVDALLRGEKVGTRTPFGEPGPTLRVVPARTRDGTETVVPVDARFSTQDFNQF